METLYHVVVLEGQSLGPYDRRTIVGMRAKNALAADSVLIDSNGRRVTVEELMREGRDDFSLSGTFSIVKARFDAQIAACEKGPLPGYEGAVEVRVQPGILRVAGRLKGKDDRVKIPLGDVPYARARSTFADLWIRGEGGALQAVSLQLASPEGAKELVKWLPDSTQPPAEVIVAGRTALPLTVVAGVAGAVLAVVAVVLVLVLKR
jgi:hypothetical protein